MVLVDQAQAPGFIHHPAQGVDIQRRSVGRVTVFAQGRHQGRDIAWLQQVPGHFANVGIFEAQAIGGILEHVFEGQLAGRHQPGQVLDQGVLRIRH
ncbi:hypothetical protein D3C86_1866170 [compost metagenome]